MSAHKQHTSSSLSRCVIMEPKTIRSLVGKVVYGTTMPPRSRNFCAKLESIDGDFAVFTTRSGSVVIDRLSQIAVLSEVPDADDRTDYTVRRNQLITINIRDE